MIFAKQNILHQALGSKSATSSSEMKNDFYEVKYLTSSVWQHKRDFF